MVTISKEEMFDAISSTQTMAQAADKLNIAFSTFKSKAMKFGLYNPNQGGAGTVKIKKKLQDVFEGKEHLVTSHLRIRLIREGFKSNACECCGITEWNNKPISFELDHVNGDRFDNSLENLRVLCPNCHSQTYTFRGRNIKK